jgi:hypothetical protein
VSCLRDPSPIKHRKEQPSLTQQTKNSDESQFHGRKVGIWKEENRKTSNGLTFTGTKLCFVGQEAKGKVALTEHHAMKINSGSGGIAPFIL